MKHKATKNLIALMMAVSPILSGCSPVQSTENQYSYIEHMSLWNLLEPSIERHECAPYKFTAPNDSLAMVKGHKMFLESKVKAERETKEFGSIWYSHEVDSFEVLRGDGSECTFEISREVLDSLESSIRKQENI